MIDCNDTKLFYPIFIASGKKQIQGWSFNGFLAKVEIKQKDRLVELLLNTCDGSKNLDEILVELSCWESKVVLELIEILYQNSIICDKYHIYHICHSAIKSEFDSSFINNNGSAINTDKAEKIFPEDQIDNELEKLLSKRNSNRRLDLKKLSGSELANVFKIAYGSRDIKNVEKISVASAGALYQTSIKAICVDKSESNNGKLYEWRHKENVLINTGSYFDVNEVEFSIVKENGFPKEYTLVVLACNVDVIGKKYGNRAYKFMYMEAGSIMQNLHLASAKYDLSMLQLGGYDEKVIQKFFNIPHGFMISAICILGK